MQTLDSALASAFEREPQLVQIAVRPGRDAAGQCRAHRLQLGKPRLAFEQLFGTEGPVFGEHLQHLAHDRALDAEMMIEDRMRRVEPRVVAVANVQPAGEAEPAVDHENLAVAAQVRIRKATGQHGGQEPRHRHARFLQGADDGGKRIARTDGIDDDAHLHPALDRRGQRGGELSSGAIVVEDIGAERDGVLGLVDGREHLRIGFGAADQRRDLVAAQQRSSGQFADEFFQAGQTAQMRRQAAEHFLAAAGVTGVEANVARWERAG